MTLNEKRILEYYRHHFLLNDTPPTYREAAEFLGYGWKQRSYIWRVVKKLVSWGYLHHTNVKTGNKKHSPRCVKLGKSGARKMNERLAGGRFVE